MEISRFSETQVIIRIINPMSQMSCFRARTGGSKWFGEWLRITQSRTSMGTQISGNRASMQALGRHMLVSTQGLRPQNLRSAAIEASKAVPSSEACSQHIHAHRAFLVRRPTTFSAPGQPPVVPTAAGNPAPHYLPLGYRLFSIDSQKADHLLVTEK